MTLTEVSYNVRKALPLVVIFLLVIFIFFYIFKLLFLYLQLQPGSSHIVINPAFGKINQPAVAVASPSAGLNFNLDTIEGQPVTATAAAKVYLLPPSYSPFKYLQQIYLMAKTVGIDTELTKHNLVKTEATFDDGKQKLNVDITNFNFTYEMSLKKLLEEDNSFFESSSVPTQPIIEDKATAFLTSLGRYPDELVKGKRNIVYLTYDPENDQLILAPQNKATNMVEVDFYRADIDGFPMVAPKYFNSQNYVIIAFSQFGFRIIKAQIDFFEKSNEQVGVYPIKTGNAAWEDLKKGKSIVVSGPASAKTVNIKKMFLGYFDPDVYQTYLQPVYVFLGDNNFVGYVPAITNEYLVE